jgi:small subunit ribosomal protein S9
MAQTHYRATGRRKRSIARVILTPGKGQVLINGRSAQDYFPVEIIRQQALLPLVKTDLQDRLNVKILVQGGGFNGQAGAVRHGIARALLEYDQGLRATLKPAGMLTRDSRKVERKKYGLRKARKAPQFSKR